MLVKKFRAALFRMSLALRWICHRNVSCLRGVRARGTAGRWFEPRSGSQILQELSSTPALASFSPRSENVAAILRFQLPSLFRSENPLPLNARWQASRSGPPSPATSSRPAPSDGCSRRIPHRRPTPRQVAITITSHRQRCIHAVRATATNRTTHVDSQAC